MNILIEIRSVNNNYLEVVSVIKVNCFCFYYID